MKDLFLITCAFLLQASPLCAQTGLSGLQVTSTEVDNILKGSYTPSVYQASTVITDPGIISSELVSRISTDSLRADLVALKNFQNRNTHSDTVSSIRGIGAARRWIYSKLQQYSAANENRLRPGYFQFDWAAANVNCNSSAMTRHRNVIAVLPGSQVVNPALFIIEAHMDSRCAGLCDVSCNAFGAGDNAAGAAMVMELARVMSKYTFQSTIVFSLNTGEEQTEMGSTAFVKYLTNNSVKIKAVSNNDVSGGVFCGHTASAPGCPAYGNIDSTGLRIFSFGGFNSLHKQWARYIKLEYKEQMSNLVNVFTDIHIMTPEDRTNRSGDHQPYRAKGYTAVRFTQANEDGDASNGTGYSDRQHTSRDSLGLDRNSDGIEDTLYLDMNYLARNTLINGNALAMGALGPDTITLVSSVLTSNRVRVVFTPAGAPAYRVAIRTSATNDWDSVYTITGRSVDTITVRYPTSTPFFISAAAVNNANIESLFSTEYSLTTQLVTLALADSPVAQPLPVTPTYYGIRLLQNNPNPFDLATTITILSGTDIFTDKAWVIISTIDGRIVRKIKIPLKKGVNEIQYDYDYGAKGTYICSLFIEGLPVQSRKMVFGLGR